MQKTVVLSVNPDRQSNWKEATWCEKLFGIVPGRLNNCATDTYARDKRVIVHGLLPDGEAIKRGIRLVNDQICVILEALTEGECLVAVNRVSVDFDNIDAVLQEFSSPQKVILTLQKVCSTSILKPGYADACTSLSKQAGDGPVKMVAGERLSKPVLSLNECPHAALYLTMDNNSEQMQDKIQPASAKIFHADEVPAKDVVGSSWDVVKPVVVKYAGTRRSRGSHVGVDDIIYKFAVNGMDHEDVIFNFPSSTDKLFDARGAFITLCHMMPQLCKTQIKNTTVTVDGRAVHISYHTCGSEVLLLCAPADILRVSELNRALLDIVQILDFSYGSISGAFKNKDNHHILSQFFALTFQRLLLAKELIDHGTKQSKYVEPFFDLFQGVRAVVLPPETKVAVDNCLSEFEAADFADMSEHCFGLRRRYTILGSCLFFKGYLLASHLPKEDLLDVTLFLRYQCLLTMCNEGRLGHLIVWREIFPSRRFNEATESTTPGYIEPKARWFLMVVAMQHAILAVELEAGGCAAQAEGFPEPDPFYLDQAKATLVHLDRLGVLTKCNNRVENLSLPSLACADWFLPHGSQKKAKSPGFSLNMLTSNSKKIIKPDSVLTKRDASPIGGSMTDLKSGRPGLRRILSWDPGFSDDEDYQSSITSGGSLNKLSVYGAGESLFASGSSKLFKGTRRQRNLLTMFDLTDLKRDLNSDEDIQGVKLTSGCDNTLFHYVHFDGLYGIFICPTQQELLKSRSVLTDHVINSFHSACLTIHEKFQRLRSKTYQSAARTKQGCIHELGILFNCCVPNWTDSKKPAPTIRYWVVGRQFGDESHEQEFYVCYHDSAQQNVIEMAFKLVQGVLV